MKVLYLVRDGTCAHDYGVDFLLTGFINVCGFENVYDWPEKDCVHLPDIAARDSCQISSDQCLPRKGHHFEDVAKSVDLVILTAPDRSLYEACSRVPATTPVVAVDFGDALGNFRQPYELVAQRRVALYCKRELPLGESFATPLPLSFPASRVVLPSQKQHRIFYWATSHGMGSPGLPRLDTAWTIANATVPPGGHFTYDGRGTVRADHPQANIWLTPGQARGTRPSPEQYWEEMSKSTIGLAFNGAINWDNNRYWENFAFGLAQVAEKPRIQIRHQPEDGTHCLYITQPENIAPTALELLRDEPRARAMGEAGHAHWLAHHCSERQAEWLIDVVGKKGA